MMTLTSPTFLCRVSLAFMAVYLLSIHAYRSWMPDRRRGYVRKKKGVLPPDPEVARRYAQNAKEPEMEFTPEIQQAIVEIVREMCLHKRWAVAPGCR